jgi:RND family efflux transporter MFP subunit
MKQSVSAPGSLVARRESHIGVEVPGRILRIHVSEGDRVEAGAPLFEIDPSEYEMAVRQAVAGLDVVRAERGQLEADLARARSLRKREVLAEQETEKLTTALAVARARERQAEEAVALARYNLGQTVVRAPYTGSVALRMADEGTTALVQPQTIVIVFQETAELEGHAAIPESQLSLVRVGDRALVHVEGLPEPVETRISAVSDSIDPATRTYLVKMQIPNREHRLKAGVFAHVEILPEPKSDALIAPRVSIRNEDGRPHLLVVREGVVIAVPVELGVTSEEVVEIVGGAQAGDEVVVGDAARTIAPGMRVSVANTTRKPAS